VKFGEVPVAAAAGAILAHNMALAGGRRLKKGRVLTRDDIGALQAAGQNRVIAAQLEPGDIGENEAAAELARALVGTGVEIGPAFTGRVNFYAKASGLCVVDRDAVDRFNLVDEAITLATVEPASIVAPKQMVATVKVIPFAVQREAVAACAEKVIGLSPFSVAAFRSKRVALIQTRLPSLKESVLDKTVITTDERLAALGCELTRETRCQHNVADLADHIRVAAAAGSELILIAGASAIIDRRDVIPGALTACGGIIVHFGMPVDPGNLMLMGRLGDADVLGLPGCARSPKINGYDWVLQRIVAGLPTGPSEVMRMGVGGLLADIPSRPMPRAKTGSLVSSRRAPRVAALILAAGRSTRMGTLNKLLIEIDGKPMVRHAAEAVTGRATPVIVVTGHQHEQIERALAGLPISFAHNPDYAQGLSTSLKRGLAALPEDIDGALVLLGDMPRVGPAEIARLIEVFNPIEGRVIIVPTRKGKRGNPVLLGKQLFHELSDIAGDSGARVSIAAHPDLVAEIEMESDGVLTDVDTPQALARLTSRRATALV
jgi:molybdenum cofactor cytidylyltransferase